MRVRRFRLASGHVKPLRWHTDSVAETVWTLVWVPARVVLLRWLTMCGVMTVVRTVTTVIVITSLTNEKLCVWWVRRVRMVSSAEVGGLDRRQLWCGDGLCCCCSDGFRS